MYRLGDQDIAGVPWRGDPVAQGNPASGLRFMAFRSAHGSGFVHYLILEDIQRVDLLELIRLG